MAINVIVCGAAGRMGKVLVSLVQEQQDARLVGAIEAAGHWALGKMREKLLALGRLVHVSDDGACRPILL
jgi:dihydrodipicolinate reductase